MYLDGVGQVVWWDVGLLHPPHLVDDDAALLLAPDSFLFVWA